MKFEKRNIEPIKNAVVAYHHKKQFLQLSSMMKLLQRYSSNRKPHKQNHSLLSKSSKLRHQRYLILRK